MICTIQYQIVIWLLQDLDAEMFLGDRKEDIEATDDQFKAKDTLEQVFELADKVTTQYYVM